MSESKIVTIYGENCDRREASEEVVLLLKEALERAESGEIIGLGLVVVNYDGSTSDLKRGQTNSVGFIGAVYRLLHGCCQ
jgi:hypothetical protein